jgi:hypothetical protein
MDIAENAWFRRVIPAQSTPFSATPCVTPLPLEYGKPRSNTARLRQKSVSNQGVQCASAGSEHARSTPASHCG